MKVNPRRACSCTADTVRGKACPVIAPGVAETEIEILVAVHIGEAGPLGAVREHREAAGHLDIQCIGTPPSSEPRARAKSSSERG